MVPFKKLFIRKLWFFWSTESKWIKTFNKKTLKDFGRNKKIFQENLYEYFFKFHELIILVKFVIFPIFKNFTVKKDPLSVTSVPHRHICMFEKEIDILGIILGIIGFTH